MGCVHHNVKIWQNLCWRAQISWRNFNFHQFIVKPCHWIRFSFLSMLHMSNYEQAEGDFIKETILLSWWMNLSEYSLDWCNTSALMSPLLYWKEWWHWSIDILSKHYMFGVKLFVMWCQDRICAWPYWMLEVLKPAFSSEIGVSGSVVTKLLQLYLICGHKLFVDNWYMSQSIVRHCSSKKLNVCAVCES